MWISRPLSAYPVFAREGSIIPLDVVEKPSNGGTDPNAIKLLITVSADGIFEILEDDRFRCSVDQIHRIQTPIKYTQAKGIVEIGPIWAAKSKPKTRE